MSEFWNYVRNWWAYIASYFIFENVIPPMTLSIYLALDEEILKEAET